MTGKRKPPAGNQGQSKNNQNQGTTSKAVSAHSIECSCLDDFGDSDARRLISGLGGKPIPDLPESNLDGSRQTCPTCSSVNVPREGWLCRIDWQFKCPHCGWKSSADRYEVVHERYVEELAKAKRIVNDLEDSVRELRRMAS